ncbi:MAG TPA: acyl-CoA dehydrogenase family protein [Thermoplasmata archaeon]|nr:acyl-CoA dehydrogenase family protein [Thermoplasmata archaeon]
MNGTADPASEAERSRVREFATRSVRPRAVEIDREDRLPPELLRQLGSEGYLALGLPTEFGGRPASTRAFCAVLEELAAASAAVAVTVAVHLSVCARPIAERGTPAQRERWLPSLARGDRIGAFALTEPGAGSDTASLRTRYERSTDGFVLTGSKTFISNAATGGLLLVFATRDPNLKSKGISAFLVPAPTPGFSVAQRFEKLGLRGSETTELLFDGVRLPAESLLGREGEGLHIALGALTAGRVGIASCALGVARAAFEEMQRAAAHDGDEAEWKRTALARAYSELAAARALVEQAAERKDAGLSFEREASVAKLVASRAAMSIASAGVDVAGPEGVRGSAAAGRLLRDARVFPIVEGTSEIQELILGRGLLSPSPSQTA